MKNTSQGTASAVAAVGGRSFELRYSAELAKFPGCPPPLLNGESKGFRFAFADKTDPRNFQPVAVLSPSRVNKLTVDACCSAYALSMFDTPANLVKTAKLLQLRHPNVLKSLGDHFVEVALSPTDGRHTPKSNSGHFDFHEYSTFKPAACVVKHEKLTL